MISPVMPVYGRVDIPFERGEGAYLYDARGRRYLDFMAGVAVNAFGHAHPYLVKALHAQAQKLWHISNVFRIPEGERLAERLCKHSFADTVFFTNSGLESFETGVKIVRKYFSHIGQPQKTRLISFQGCFHGRSMTSIAAAKTEKMVGGFGPLIDMFDQVPFGDLKAVEAAITPQTAGIVIEPVQGEGGMRVGTPEFLKGLRALCDKHGLLLFFDEIQCGMGRTGKMFAYEWSGVTPDVMSIAKALGGGFPVGACLATEKAAAGMTAGTHGSTFGGNPLAMAVGNAILDLMEDPAFLPQVNKIGDYLWKKLDEVARGYQGLFNDHRGKGLMQGLRCTQAEDPPRLLSALRKNGLLCMSASDNVIRVLPPLNINEQQVDEAADIMNKTIREYLESGA
ncbi:MAG TPA: aspartate aminotransferase family protein [Alphaproteobacteria bacterium]|nr:aspartate aminotransferase family protein [Alphaproteobacteria bacterium]